MDTNAVFWPLSIFFIIAFAILVGVGVNYYEHNDPFNLPYIAKKLDKLPAEYKKKIDLDSYEAIKPGDEFTSKAQYFVLFKKVLNDAFIVSEDNVVKMYSVYKKNEKDSMDKLLIDAAIDPGGEKKEEFIQGLQRVLFDILYENGDAFRVDWKYDDHNIETTLNKMLKDKDLRIEFTDASKEKPFLINLFDLENKQLIMSEPFEYPEKKHDLKLLMTKVNEMLSDKDLIFVDADDGSDCFQFILFEKWKYERLKEAFGNNFIKLITTE